jgi:hypothetical protein
MTASGTTERPFVLRVIYLDGSTAEWEIHPGQTVKAEGPLLTVDGRGDVPPTSIPLIDVRRFEEFPLRSKPS